MFQVEQTHPVRHLGIDEDWCENGHSTRQTTLWLYGYSYDRFSKFSNRQTMKEAQVVFEPICIILISLQTNDIAVVLDIIW